MRKFSLPSTLALALLLLCIAGKTQDFSNRGKDFWIAYAGHIDGTASVMGLYLTSDVNTSGNVQVGPNNIPFTITANQVTKLFIGPGAGGNAPNLLVHNAQSDAINPNAGIHVTSQRNIVVYAHIIRAARSGATLVLPTPVLGKEYVIPSYRNLSTQGAQEYGYGQITVVAVEPNTTIEIVPKTNSRFGTHVADAPFQVTLNNVGDVYQLQSEQNADFSGSTVKSVSTAGGGCKPIAVFASTTWSAFDCGGALGGDNLYQQLFPTKSWGKKFVTAPFINKPYDIIRVFITDRSTVVNKTELGVTAQLTALAGGNYYEYKTNNPTIIEADKPVSVVHYITAQTCGGGNSDPEMILINPIEQTLRNITLFSAHANHVPAGQTQVTAHFLNIVIPTVSKGSLRIDNNPPTGTFIDIPGAGFSYLQENVTASSGTNPVHNVRADTGFTAIVYGYGNVESYGYNAGTNLKDLNQYVSVNNQYATVDFPAACKGAPFNLSMTFPYQPTVIKWQFNGLFPDITLNSPAFSSTSVVNGITLYKYNLAGSFTAPATAGTYPIRITAQNPTPDGCDGIQEIDYDLEVFEPPVADFNFTTNGCVSSPVAFTDNSTNPSGRTIIHRHWNFGDAATTNDVATTSHTYSAAGAYTVKYTVITDVGCKSKDTVSKVVTLNDPPIAGFAPAAPYCAGKSITFNDISTGVSIIKWTWNFGDATPAVIANTNAAQTHTYTNAGNYTVTLQVETASGCLSTVFSQSVTVNPNPVVDFSLPVVCLPVGAAQFNSLSTIADGSQALFSYSWDFGDATPAGTGASPLHNYAGVGPFTIGLTVTSNNGCITTGTKTLSTVYPEPVASFTAPAELCLGATANFNSTASAASGSTVTEWTWSFGDMGTATTANPTHTYAAANSYTVTLSIKSAAGCQSVSPANIATKTVVVNPLPTADFTIGLPGCVTKSVSFTDASAPNAGNIVKWTWNFGDGSPALVSTTGGAVTHSYAATGSFPVTLQVETNKGCISTVTSKNVQINPLPDAAFVPPVICVNDVAAPFADGSSVAGGSITGWQWNFGDANATPGNPNIATSQNATHHYTLPGDYTAQLIAISNSGCRDTVEHTFTVNGGVLTPAFTVQNSGPGALCSNKTISIKDASQVNAGKIIRTEIFWDLSDLTIKTTDTDPQAGEVYTHTYPEFGGPATRTVTVRFDTYSGVTCVNSATQTITLLATPMLSSDAVAPICSNSAPFSLNVQMLNQNVLQGSGVFSGPGVTQNGEFTPENAGAGTHSINYTFNADNGCSNSVVKTVIVDPTPDTDAGPDKVVLQGGSVMLTPTVINNIPVTYAWTPATYLNNPAIAKPEASPPTDFTYTLTITSDKGCFTTDDVFVKLLKDPVIPNIFSPNGDGIHDRWVIEYLESYPGCIVQIYNRYGQMIHRVVNYTTAWDGRINGKDAPVGTYYYVIDPKNGRKPMTGYVDIIR